MTKYAIDVFRGEDWEPIALFSDEVSLDAMVACAGAQVNADDSILNARVIDMTTGELLWDWESGLPSSFILETTSDEAFDAFLKVFTADDDVKRRDPDDWDDWDFNEDCGYDPYLGCYTDDC